MALFCGTTVLPVFLEKAMKLDHDARAPVESLKCSVSNVNDCVRVFERMLKRFCCITVAVMLR